MKFYRFETKQQFMAAVGTTETEFTKDGVQFSVVGKIPDGGFEPVIDEAGQPVKAVGGEQKPDGTTYKKGEAVMQPTFKAGWHVNASGEVEGWDEMAVVPTQPVRVFG